MLQYQTRCVLSSALECITDFVLYRGMSVHAQQHTSADVVVSCSMLFQAFTMVEILRYLPFASGCISY